MNRFIDSLDPDRLIFSARPGCRQVPDRQQEIDDAIERQDLTVPFSIFNTYQMRIIERMTFARSLLKQGFDFNKQEDFSIVRDKEPWPRSSEESNDLWRKRVKNDWLRLKLAGRMMRRFAGSPRQAL